MQNIDILLADDLEENQLLTSGDTFKFDTIWIVICRIIRFKWANVQVCDIC